MRNGRPFSFFKMDRGRGKKRKKEVLQPAQRDIRIYKNNEMKAPEAKSPAGVLALKVDRSDGSQAQKSASRD